MKYLVHLEYPLKKFKSPVYVFIKKENPDERHIGHCAIAKAINQWYPLAKKEDFLITKIIPFRGR